MTIPPLPVAPSLSIVIPIHNEAGNIAPLIDEIHSALASYSPVGESFEILMVDDASVDTSRSEIIAAQSKYAQVRLIKHSRRTGMSNALRNGIRRARSEWIATIDGDGQNDPTDIPRLCDLAWSRKNGRNRSLLVMGIRANRKDTPAKRLASRTANAFRRAVLHDRCPDTGCALKLFRRDDWLELPFFNGLHRFTPAIFNMYGCEVIFTPINDRQRNHGISKSDFAGRAIKGLVDILGVVWLKYRTPTPPERGSE